MSEVTDQPAPQHWPEFADPSHLDRIIEIIAKEGAIERSAIIPTATLDSLGLASLDVVTILMGVEDELGIYIPMSAELSGTRNLAEFVTAIARATALVPDGPAKA